MLVREPELVRWRHSGQLHREQPALSDVTVGFWQNIYKGNYGRVALGAQYEYIKRESFDGIGGTVSTDDNIVLTSLRYYPF